MVALGIAERDDGRMAICARVARRRRQVLVLEHQGTDLLFASVLASATRGRHHDDGERDRLATHTILQPAVQGRSSPLWLRSWQPRSLER